MPVTRSGNVYPFDLNAGIGQDVAYSGVYNFADMSSGDMAQAAPSTANMQATGGTVPAKVSTLWYIFAIGVFLVAYKFAVEHESSKMDFSFMGIGVYNMIAGGTMAMLYIILVKTVLNKYPVAGLTDLVNVV